MNATGFFKPTTGKPELDRHQFGGVLGGPIVQEQGVLLRRLRGPAPDAQGDRLCDDRDAGAAPGHPLGRRARPAHRRRLSGRHADPDDRASRARSCRRCPTRTSPATTNNYSIAAGVHRRLQQGRRPSRRAGQPGAVDVRALRLPQPDHRRPAEHPAAVRRRRQRPHLRAQPPVRARQRRGCRRRRRCSKCGSATRGPQAGKNPPALGSDERVRAVRPARPADRSAASPAACRRRSSPATPTSAGRRPIRSGSTRPSTTRR